MSRLHDDKLQARRSLFFLAKAVIAFPVIWIILFAGNFLGTLLPDFWPYATCGMSCLLSLATFALPGSVVLSLPAFVLLRRRNHLPHRTAALFGVAAGVVFAIFAKTVLYPMEQKGLSGEYFWLGGDTFWFVGNFVLGALLLNTALRFRATSGNQSD